MHDTRIEDGLRATLRAEGGDLPMTITAAELQRRLAARDGLRRGRRLSLIAAAVAVVAIEAVAAMSNGWLRLPATGALAPGDCHPASGSSLAPSTTPTGARRRPTGARR